MNFGSAAWQRLPEGCGAWALVSQGPGRAHTSKLAAVSVKVLEKEALLMPCPVHSEIRTFYVHA